MYTMHFFLYVKYLHRHYQYVFPLFYISSQALSIGFSFILRYAQYPTVNDILFVHYSTTLGLRV
jgi:hypothetical protein